MARRATTNVDQISENGYRIYLNSELTTDYAFPFSPGDGVEVCVVPHVGLVVVPEDSDFDPTDLNL